MCIGFKRLKFEWQREKRTYIKRINQYETEILQCYDLLDSRTINAPKIHCLGILVIFLKIIRVIFRRKCVTLHCRQVCDIFKKAHFRFIPHHVYLDTSLMNIGINRKSALLGLYLYLCTKYIQVGYHFIIHIHGCPSPRRRMRQDEAPHYLFTSKSPLLTCIVEP